MKHGQSGNSWRDGAGISSGIFPFPAFELLQRNSGAIFSSVFAYCPTGNVNVLVEGQAEQLSGEFVSGDYFHGLAVTPAAGPMTLPEDDRAGGPAVVVLSFPFSQRRFGDWARAIGQSIVINGIPFTVVGIAPPGSLAWIPRPRRISIFRSAAVFCCAKGLEQTKPAFISTRTTIGPK